MTAPHYITARQGHDRSPLLRELEQIYEALDDDGLIARLKEYRWTGRPGYSVEALWRSYLAGFVLNLPSTNALIRRLQEDAPLARFCGFGRLPSRWTFNRFVGRLAKHLDLAEEVLASTTAEVRDHLHGAFGYMMAVDATVVSTYSDPDKKTISDPEASWTVKEHNTQGKPKWHFGYKLHVVADADTELPITAIVTTASVNDTTQLLPLLAKAQAQLGLIPRWVLADAGYDSNANVEGIVHQHAARPIIKMRQMKRRDLRHREYGTLRQRFNMNSPQWKQAYSRRQSIERLFSRLKGHRALDRHCRRGLEKVTLHCLSAVLVFQAEAVAKLRRDAIGEVRSCTRKVA